MRKNLGKNLILFLVLLSAELFATTYSWSAYSSKNEAFVNEAIHLKYVCEFSDRGELYTIDFNPVMENEEYSIKLLSEDRNIVDGKRVNFYEFVAFVKKPMIVEFNFDVLMKKTTKDSIENTVLGRDNVEKEEFLTRLIRQEILRVDIKETNNPVVGDFSIISKGDDKTDIKAYEPYHLKVSISGIGNFEAIKPLEFKIEGVKVFEEEPSRDIKLTKEGYVGTWNQSFAFVGEKDFQIPSLRISYFDTKTHTIKEFLTKQVEVKVESGFKKEELLDSKDESELFNFDFIYYILTFIAGFLVSKIKFKTKSKDSKDDSFMQKVKNAKSLNELNMILVLKDEKRFAKLIFEIESKENISLNKAKKIVEQEEDR